MRILTWNVNGDCLVNDRTQNKIQEMGDIIRHWDNRGNPIAIVCLQEAARQSGIQDYFNQFTDWNNAIAHEQANGGGRCSIILVRKPFKIEEQGIVNLAQFHPQNSGSTPTRVPFYVKIDIDGQTLCVYTWHATLGSNQREDFENFSRYLETNLNGPTILAGDFNQTAGPLMREYYSGFTGCVNHLDYIMGWKVDITDGISSDSSNSDHVPISADFSFTGC